MFLVAINTISGYIKTSESQHVKTLFAWFLYNSLPVNVSLQVERWELSTIIINLS
ncbi:hypothetical protein EC843_10660 [Buttiauxella sp. JUb87]|jgi:hypothetical protein|nr:hypothetical protein EC843_10660 [Buttiauxella sp. JUb87]